MTRLNGAAVDEVFDFWREAMESPRSKLDAKRRKAIGERFKDGYSVEDIQLGIMGCRASDFHMGHNDRGTRYCSIDLICRDAEHLDRFIELGEKVANTELARVAKREPKPEEGKRERSEDTQRKIDAVRAKLGRVRA